MKNEGDFSSFKKRSPRGHSESQNSENPNTHRESKTSEIERLNTIIDNLKAKLENQTTEFQNEASAMKTENQRLSFELEMKLNDKEELSSQLLKQTELVESMDIELSDLKQSKGKPVMNGLKTKLDAKTIKEMQDYAYEIVDSDSKFYQTIADKFKVSKGCVFTYCKDIYKGRKSK